ncbi:uncharacterized protein LOC128995886 [Macrosteles quadrilineatus]|uniref:uncharacterized protein LOC128995886 n=1 Tax=Macrosteles quadrilineatus TaxID=74068 RepID=UPI0023E1DBD8|nr:uncharacterized protein LOC128995886 [Macrosteles quadrilineatus]
MDTSTWLALMATFYVLHDQGITKIMWNRAYDYLMSDDEHPTTSEIAGHISDVNKESASNICDSTGDPATYVQTQTAFDRNPELLAEIQRSWQELLDENGADQSNTNGQTEKLSARDITEAKKTGNLDRWAEVENRLGDIRKGSTNVQASVGIQGGNNKGGVTKEPQVAKPEDLSNAGTSKANQAGKNSPNTPSVKTVESSNARNTGTSKANQSDKNSPNTPSVNPVESSNARNAAGATNTGTSKAKQVDKNSANTPSAKTREAFVFGDDKCIICPWAECNLGDWISGCERSIEEDLDTLTSKIAELKGERTKLVPILAFHTENERKKLTKDYENKEKIKLWEKVEEMFVGPGERFKKTMVDLAKPLDEVYADQLHYILTKLLEPRLTNHPKMSFGKTFPQKVAARKDLIQIIITLTPCLMQKVRNLYKEKYRVELEDHIDRTLSTHQTKEKRAMGRDYIDYIKKLVTRTSYVDGYDQKKETRLLLDEIFFKLSLPGIKILVEKLGVDRIRSTFNIYSMYDTELHATILDIAVKQQKFFAEELRTLLKEKKVDDVKFINLIRGHFGIDLKDIINKYNEESLKKKPLEDPLDVAFGNTQTTKKHYYNAMIALFTGNTKTLGV